MSWRHVRRNPRHYRGEPWGCVVMLLVNGAIVVSFAVLGVVLLCSGGACL